MKYDLQAPNATRVYRIVVKGDLLYVLAHSTTQAASMAKKAGFTVLSIARWVD